MDSMLRVGSDRLDRPKQASRNTQWLMWPLQAVFRQPMLCCPFFRPQEGGRWPRRAPAGTVHASWGLLNPKPQL
jgi:hypothetical protein